MLWSKQGVLLLSWLFTLLAPAQPTSAGVSYGISVPYTQTYEHYPADYMATARLYAGKQSHYETMSTYPYVSAIYENGASPYSASGSSGAPPYPPSSAPTANPYGNFNPGTVKSLIPGYLVDRYLQRLNPDASDTDQGSANRFVQTAGKIISMERSNRGEVGLSAPRTQVRYVVQKGDTLYRIARLFGTSIDVLMAENRISDPTKLQVGQRLTVPLVSQDMPAWLNDSSEISDVFYATLTAYTAGYESTGKTPSHPAYGITASGAKVKENFTIAVDPDVIPLGSLVYIEGLGIRKAEDTGSAIKGKKIDVYMPDLEEALKFGVKENVKVYVLKSGNSSKQDVSIASSGGS